MKRINHALAFIVFAGVISSCGNKTTPVKDQPKNDSVTSNGTVTVVDEDKPKAFYYQGVLPCDKCDGMTTTLELYEDKQSASLGITHMDDPFVDRGYDFTLNTERGYEKDPDATVYILNWDKPLNEQRVFVRETGNDSTIFEIKTNRKRFTDKKNHSLTKKMAGE